MLSVRQRATPDELRDRARLARESLRACALCERRCGADRLAGDPAPCGLGADTWSFKRHISFSEELDLLPSYMIYLDGCNLRCRFCVQAPACFDPRRGEPVDPAALARECGSVVARGARTINLLGGEPSLHLHTILALAAESPEPLPLVLNSNMYMTPEVLALLDGVITLYLADLKFGADSCALRIAGVHNYVPVVRRNLLLARARAPVIVRHLLMPGHLECCLEPTARWLADHMPDAPFTLMTSYVPAWRAASSPDELGRTPTDAEAARAERLITELGLRRSG